MQQLSIEERRIARAKWQAHRHRADRSSIGFQLTFDEWLTIWLESGHWNERGCHKGQYVMSRRGDTGPYAVGNVFIQTHTMNIKEAKIGKKRPPFSEEHKRKVSETMRGRPKSEETKRRMRGKKRPPRTEEYLRKQSEAQRAAWIKRKTTNE